MILNGIMTLEDARIAADLEIVAAVVEKDCSFTVDGFFARNA